MNHAAGGGARGGAAGDTRGDTGGSAGGGAGGPARHSADGGSHCDSLEALERHMGECHRCPLGETRTTLVFGVGDPDAELMFIGEAPGKQEDLKGEPFVGAAGRLLDELLEGIGLERGDVYIANVLKCRPPGNRDPRPEEIEACTPYLREQVRLIDPVVIATLGNFAARFMLDTNAGITKLRGRLFRSDGRQVVPVYHPAAALYTPAKKGDLEEDFRRLRTVLDRGHPGALGGSVASDEPGLPDGPDGTDGSDRLDGPDDPAGSGVGEPLTLF